MAKAEAGKVKKGNFLINYFRETRAELRKVHWPSQQEARDLTLVVVGATVAMAILLGLLDFVFDRLLSGIIDLNLFYIGLSIAIVIGLFVVGIIIVRE